MFLSALNQRQARYVRMQFLSEFLVLSLTGGLIGVVLGAAAAAI